jgi:hypothetical protein
MCFCGGVATFIVPNRFPALRHSVVDAVKIVIAANLALAFRVTAEPVHRTVIATNRVLIFADRSRPITSYVWKRAPNALPQGQLIRLDFSRLRTPMAATAVKK